MVANETKVVVQREEIEATKKATETQAIADDAQRDLDEALPALVSGFCPLVCLFVCLLVRLFFCLFVCLFVCLFACFFVCLFVCLFV